MSLTTAKFSTRRKIVNLILPHDANASAITTSNCDIFSLENYDKATIILQFGVVNASANLGTLTIEKCTDVAGSNNTAMAFTYRTEGTAGGDTLDAISSATSSGVDLTTDLGVVDGTLVVIEIRAEELAPAHASTTNYTSLSLLLGSPGSYSVLMSGIAILDGARYQNNALPTAIA